MYYLFKITDVYLRVESDCEFPIPEHLSLFQIEEREISSHVDIYRYRFIFTDNLPEPKGDLIAERGDIRVYSHNDFEMRFISALGRGECYGCYEEIAEGIINVYFLSSHLESLKIDTVFCSLLGLEKLLLKQESIILHCAFNAYKEQAILFSAPSETGKTTHANLWNRYLGSRTINGDRALLRKVDGRWLACGWPICGSSEICYNESYPIKAIVMIHRAQENSAYQLNKADAFRQIYSQITMNRWNTVQQLDAMEVLDQLLDDIPVYQLNCNISEGAVRCIAKEIYNEDLL